MEKIGEMDEMVMVSICCVSYNHERFIRDAIEGFLMQKTSFPIEIIIHDDASTDSTADIIREYEKKFPDLIKPIYQKENQYSKGIQIHSAYVWPKCTGKYMALCEGDDYWTDPYKLQKQVDFLEANEDYILCFTDCKTIDEKGNVLKDSTLKKQHDKTYTHLDMPFLAPVLTRLFRNKYLDIIPWSLNLSPGGDVFLLVWQSKFGKIKYFNYPSSAYRVTRQGMFSGKSDFEKQRLIFIAHFSILAIAEKGLIEKLIYLLIRRLPEAKRAARIEAENLTCEDLYEKLLKYFRAEGELKRADWLDCIRWKLSLIVYYHVVNLIVWVARKLQIKKDSRQILKA